MIDMRKGKSLSWEDIFKPRKSKNVNLNYFGTSSPNGTALYLLKAPKKS
jgi:hypothetical protein